MNDARSRRSEQVKQAAMTAGFDAVGICDLRPIERDALTDWLARGYAGTMTYMHRQARRRREPAAIVTGATRAVVVLSNYFQPDPPQPPAVRVSRYAWGEDYHHVVGDRLTRLSADLIAMGSSPARTRAYVDAGPVPERELAQRAGLGWIGRNTMLIDPRRGSFTFIGTVFTDLDLATDQAFRADHCGTCRRCLDACPTQAFPHERILDARRCISYLTIEYRAPLAPSDAARIGDWLFGCDICQDVCPWNIRFARASDEPRFAPRAELVSPDLEWLRRADPASFQERYAGTAFERMRGRSFDSIDSQSA